MNAIALHVMCLHLGDFKCFYKAIFLYIAENNLPNDHRSHFKSLFFFLFAICVIFLYPGCLFFICFIVFIQIYVIASIQSGASVKK